MMETQEKRDSPRTYPNSLIGVAFSPLGEAEEHFGLVNDVSAGGWGITSPVSIPPGALLEIFPGEDGKGNFLEEDHFLGEVRWCVLADYGMEVYYWGVKTLSKLFGQ